MKVLARALALLLAVPVLAACGGPPRSDAVDGTDSVHSYSTRGVVRALPSPERPGSELQIRHETIPEFRDQGGEVVGMESMTMPFPASASLLEGVAVGDKVAFDFEVRWQGSPPLRVTRLEVLPSDTLLEFEAAD